MGLLDIGVIVAVSVATAVVSDLTVKRLVLDREDFKDLTRKVERQQKEVDMLKARPAGGDKAKRHERELAAAEGRLQEDSTKVTGLRMRGTMLVGVLAIAVFWLLGTYYEAAVVARLPFEPVWLFKSMAQRTLTGGEALTDQCGYLFIYVLSQAGLRPIISKALGTEGPKTPGLSMLGGGGRQFGMGM